MSPTKFKEFIFALYPELAKFQFLKKPDLLPILTLTPLAKKILRIGIPILVSLVIFAVSALVGNILIGIFQPKTITTPTVSLPESEPVVNYESQFIPIKSAIENFNPQLPDPLPPVFDENISLNPSAR